jgi:hypothetical protein
MTPSELLLKHQSDKVNAQGSTSHHNYNAFYDSVLPPYRDRATAILELGVLHGCSLRAWREYFVNATIYGIDNDSSRLNGITDRERIILFHADTTNRDAFLELTARLPLFDFICDDCSHIFSEQLFALAVLWPKLKPGGIYIVEDIYTARYLELFRCFQNVELIDLVKPGGCQDDRLAVMRKK